MALAAVFFSFVSSAAHHIHARSHPWRSLELDGRLESIRFSASVLLGQYVFLRIFFRLHRDPLETAFLMFMELPSISFSVGIISFDCAADQEWFRTFWIRKEKCSVLDKGEETNLFRISIPDKGLKWISPQLGSLSSHCDLWMPLRKSLLIIWRPEFMYSQIVTFSKGRKHISGSL